jgi:transposase
MKRCLGVSHMDAITDETKGGFRRVELLTGPGRRRRWSGEEKARIVAETLVPGARVSDVARRWQLHPQQLFGWRHQARQDTASKRRTDDEALSFVPIIAERDECVVEADVTASRSSIEIELAGAVVRAMDGVSGEWLTEVLRAVRRSSGTP